VEHFARYKTAVEAHLVRENRLGGHKKPDDLAVKMAMLQEMRALNRNFDWFFRAAMRPVCPTSSVRFGC
jgi:hypothetical protein